MIPASSLGNWTKSVQVLNRMSTWCYWSRLESLQEAVSNAWIPFGWSMLSINSRPAGVLVENKKTVFNPSSPRKFNPGLLIKQMSVPASVWNEGINKNKNKFEWNSEILSKYNNNCTACIKIRYNFVLY